MGQTHTQPIFIKSGFGLTHFPTDKKSLYPYLLFPLNSDRFTGLSSILLGLQIIAILISILSWLIN